MITFLAYQLKVAVIMAVFYIFFRLLLIKDTWHRLNRIVLLSTALLSLLLPVCIITIHKTEVLSMPVAQLPQAVSSTPAQPSTPWWHIVLMTVYAAGVVFVLTRVLASALRVRGIIRHARKEVMADGTTVYVMPGNDPSFSWMGHIVISEADWSNHETAVIDHEKAHVTLRHSIDVLITDIIAALQWFNPAIWMLRIDLRAVHEYEADDTVLRAGTDIRSYQYLLISKAAAMNGYTIANNFNHSILKNRIFMMEKETSTRRSLLRALYLLPLVCISLALNAQTKVNYVYNDGNNSSGLLIHDNNTVIPRIAFDEIKMDGESLEGMTLDGILRLLPSLQTDTQGNITTTQGDQIKRIIINGKVLYKKEESANAGTDNSKISDVDSETDMDMEFSSHSDESVDGIIKSLPGVEFDEYGKMTVNGKAVRKILVNGKEYFSDAQSPIYANDIVDEVEGKTPEGYSRNIMVNIDRNTDQVSITSEDQPDSKWNATAYRIPDAETLKGLVHIDEETGEMTVNGKIVSRVIVNGKAVPMNEVDSISRAVLKQAMGE
ncbi:MAG: M56 family metallopeptidase [Bacteroidaceae bacterium]|nr:M56 family metallopeptidase [Bacteroidaceae bacterium]